MFTYAKTATVSTKEIMCVVLQDTVKKNRRRVYWPLMNTSLLYFPNIRSCLPRGPATAGIRTRFQQMKPKEFKTLMLIYFCSVLSKSIWTGIPPSLPSSHMEFKRKLVKSISSSLSFPLSHIMKNPTLRGVGWGCQAKLCYRRNSTQLGPHGKRVSVFDFLSGWD